MVIFINILSFSLGFKFQIKFHVTGWKIVFYSFKKLIALRLCLFLGLKTFQTRLFWVYVFLNYVEVIDLQKRHHSY